MLAPSKEFLNVPAMSETKSNIKPSKIVRVQNFEPLKC